jgi:beta-glucosidase
VFVNDVTGEGSDRSSLSLPGDQNQLIEAVAKAYPHTVVVLNTGGPVLAPWLSRVPVCAKCGTQGRSMAPRLPSCFSATSTRPGNR